VIGLSALLSLLVPAFFFAAGSLPATAGLGRRPRPVVVRGMVLGVAAPLVAYAWLALSRPAWVAALPVSRPPLSYVAAAISTLLLFSAAARQLVGQAMVRGKHEPVCLLALAGEDDSHAIAAA
jgi:hypothetical protein